MTNLLVPVDLIDLGCSVYTLRADQTDADMPSVKGGIVVSIETDVDGETGEIQRRFVTATPWRRNVRVDVVNADEVADAQPISQSAVRNLIRTACAVVGAAKRIGSHEARCLDIAHRMKEILG